MERKIGLGLVLVLVLISLNACATVGGGTGTLKTDAPLPPAPVTIIQPGPEITPQLAALSGAWFGRWDGQMDHILIVEEISTEEKITAIYSFGKGFGFNPGWFRATGKFAEGELQLFRRGATPFATYQMRGGTLKAVYQSNGMRSEASMKKVNLNDLLVSK